MMKYGMRKAPAIKENNMKSSARSEWQNALYFRTTYPAEKNKEFQDVTDAALKYNKHYFYYIP